MSSKARIFRDSYQKEIARLFEKLCVRQNRWQVWCDFVEMVAVTISNAVDRTHAKERERLYNTISGKYDKAEMSAFAEMFGYLVESMEANPDQDFLGELYMALELGNKNTGQFFTPYSLCKCTAAISGADYAEKIKRQGWISVTDPACGAGALLVAFANMMRKAGTNYQPTVLFTAQDIDGIVACMCYIQLSLLGCAGYVVVGDTLINPATAYDSRGLIPVDNGNVWYTPMYFHQVWQGRVMMEQMRLIFGTSANGPEGATEPESDSVPEPPAIEPEYQFSENEFGQLTIF